MVVRRAPGCAQVFILFKGLDDRFMMAPFRFLRETGIDDRNLVLLRDPHEAFYQFGIDSARAGFGALIDTLRATVDSLTGVSEVHVIGTSAGAYAALMAGHVLQADEVHAFGPPASLAEISEYRSRPLRGIDPAAAEYDLARVLAVHNGRTAYRVYYNRDFARDRSNAERLGGLPAVDLVAMPGRGHGVVTSLQQQGRLAGLFAPYRATAAGPSSFAGRTS